MGAGVGVRFATDAAATGDVGIVGFGARVAWMALSALCLATNGTLDSFAVEPAAAPDGAEGFINISVPTAAGVCAPPCLGANQCSATNGTLDSFAMEPAVAPDGAEGFITIGMPTAAAVCAPPCLAANTAVDSFAMEEGAAPNGEGVIGITTVGMQGTGLL